MDRTDKQILQQLQENCQISNQELAEHVALSPSPCSRRVKQLEESGIIEKHVAILNPKKIGLKLTIMLLIGLDSHSSEKMKNFEKTVKTIAEVIECHLITGQAGDYLLKVVVPDMDYYQALLLEKITTIEGVNNVLSNFVLHSVKNETALPLNQL